MTSVFNIDLMKNDSDTHTSTFLDTVTSNLFVPHIIHPTTYHSTFENID